MKIFRYLAATLLALPLLGQPVANLPLKPGRDASQAVDEEYTRKIREYTTETFFTSPLTDYLPASKTVPTPKVVLGDIAGAPGILPYSADVYRYMRMLEQATPRVKVFSIGRTEEGREMIAVAVASERLLATLDENRARLAKLADPRTIKLDDAEAEKLVAASTPIYYITGTIHSTETGAPTALMELAYRLAVDESAYIKSIRDNVITLITPVVEVDGRDRAGDIYRWHRQPLQKRLRRLGRERHHEAVVRLRQIDRQIVSLPLLSIDHRERFPEVRLGISRRVLKRHEHLLLAQLPQTHVVLHDGVPTAKPVLLSQSFVDSFRRVALLPGPLAILLKDRINHSHPRIQLRPLRRLLPPVARRNRILQHLPNGLTRQPILPGHLPLALPLHLNRSPYSCIEFHCVHPSGIPRNTPFQDCFLRSFSGGLLLLRQGSPLSRRFLV